MKQVLTFNFRLIIHITIVMLVIIDGSFFAQGKIRIGTYDSRAIAVAYYNSDYASSAKKIMNQLKLDNHKAKEEKDTVKSQKLEREGELRQAMMHEQGFGTGSVRECMLAIKNELDQLAQKENLDIIVSKWELNYSAENTELVDVTEQVANLYQSKMSIKELLKEMKGKDPIKEAYLIDD